METNLNHNSIVPLYVQIVEQLNQDIETGMFSQTGRLPTEVELSDRYNVSRITIRRAVDELVQPYAGGKVAKVAGIEARGFILGGAVAHQLSAGFVPIRKKGKLPHQTVRMAYALEYGQDEIEMHVDAVAEGEQVLLVDDLIATGGTAVGAVHLLRECGAQVVAACFVVDLPDLGGVQKLEALGVPVRTLISFAGH